MRPFRRIASSSLDGDGATGLQPSSRRLQVLQPHNSNYYSGLPGPNVSAIAGADAAAAQAAAAVAAGPSALSLHRELTAAESPHGLLSLLRDAASSPGTCLLPQSVEAAMLRLAGWHTDAAESGLFGDALSRDELSETLSILEPQVAANTSGISAEALANIVWAAATVRGNGAGGSRVETSATPLLNGVVAWWDASLAAMPPTTQTDSDTDTSDENNGGAWRMGVGAGGTVASGCGGDADGAWGMGRVRTPDLVSLVWGLGELMALECAAAEDGDGAGGGAGEGSGTREGNGAAAARAAGGGSGAGLMALKSSAAQEGGAAGEGAGSEGREGNCASAAGRGGGGGASPASSRDGRCRVLNAAAAALACRLRGDSGGVGGGSAAVPEVQPQDITDIAWGLAASGHRSPAVGRLVDAVAHEAYRQLSNRHSLSAAFLPADIVALLKAFVRLPRTLGHPSVARMLDAVAGGIAKKVKARHVQAVSKPGDIRDVLCAFASLQHNSVAVPEMLRALSRQVASEVAAHGEWVHAHVLAPAEARAFRSGVSHADADAVIAAADDEASASWGCYLGAGIAVGILAAYRTMNTYPGSLTVASVLLASLNQLDGVVGGGSHGGSHGRAASERVPAASACVLLSHLAAFRYHPGERVMAALVRHATSGLHSHPAADAAAQANTLLPKELLDAESATSQAATTSQQPPAAVPPKELLDCVCACAELGQSPPEALLDACCNAVLLGATSIQQPRQAERLLHALLLLHARGARDGASSRQQAGPSQGQLPPASASSYQLPPASEEGAASSGSSPPVLTVQRFGLVCMALREGGGVGGGRGSSGPLPSAWSSPQWWLPQVLQSNRHLGREADTSKPTSIILGCVCLPATVCMVLSAVVAAAGSSCCLPRRCGVHTHAAHTRAAWCGVPAAGYGRCGDGECSSSEWSSGGDAARVARVCDIMAAGASGGGRPASA
ncbi:hypothetical protein FOA52_008678 [Chlamydomonas sp. UWO 241]|nr:hypothetical protein FOA52_008678 [Chlamydomonas sp. UWO 241]